MSLTFMAKLAADRAGAIGSELGHEGQAHSRGFGKLLQALLEYHVAVGHLERPGVAHVELVLAFAPFTFGRLHRHARELEVTPCRGVEALGARTLQDVIV